MNTGILKAIVAAGCLAAAGAALPAAPPKATVPTPAEEAGYLRYTQSEGVTAFLSLLGARTGELSVRTMGRSLAKDEYGARDLYLAVLSENSAGSPAELDRTKPTVLVVAAQHGNEQSAKEAALWLLRDLAVGDLKPLLKRLNVLIMPQVNPYGNFFDVRTNELGLDMNRDHVKLETEGVRAIHRVFRAWMPEVTIDVHEKGDDYYRVSIGCVSNVNIGRGLQDFSRQIVLSEVDRSLRKRNITFHEYLITEDLGVDTSSGAAFARGPAGAREQMKRYSTTDLNDGRNSLGIFETLSFIQEGASRHDLETLKDRTTWQYHGLRAFLGSVAGHGPEILKLVGDHRSRLIEKAASPAAGDLVHLRMRYARDPGQPELILKAFERSRSPVRGVLKVDKKAGETITTADIAPYPGPADRKIVEEVVKNWFPEVEPALSVPRPHGYLIRGDRLDIVEALLALGIEVDIFEKGAMVEAAAYHVKDIVPSGLDYLAPERIEVELADIPRHAAQKGDFYVDIAQPAANLVPCLLEPQSEYGFIRYWKFGLVPEAGGVFAILRVTGNRPGSLLPYKRWPS